MSVYIGHPKTQIPQRAFYDCSVTPFKNRESQNGNNFLHSFFMDRISPPAKTMSENVPIIADECAKAVSAAQRRK